MPCISALKSGASALASWTAGPSARANGRSSVIVGFTRLPNAASRCIASDPSMANVGSALNVPSICSFRRANVDMTRSQFAIEPRNWPRRCESASNTTPVFATSCRTAPSCEFTIRSSSSVSLAKPGTLPSASLRSRPRPWSPTAWSWNQVCSAARVLGSKVRKIASSSTLGESCAVGSDPPSGSLAALGLPGVTST